MGAEVRRQRRSSGANVRTVWPMRAAILPRRDAFQRGLSGHPVGTHSFGLGLSFGARHGALVARGREQGEHANEDTTRQDYERDHTCRHKPHAATAVEQGAVLGAMAVEGAQGQADPAHIEQRREPPERFPRGRGGGGELHGRVP